jgi:hypothetical protein
MELCIKYANGVGVKKYLTHTHASYSFFLKQDIKILAIDVRMNEI